MSKPFRVYLCGPMTGVRQFNHPAFNAAAEHLRGLGYEVFSPAEHDRENGFTGLGTDGKPMTGYEDLSGLGFSYREFLSADLTWIAEKGDAIAVLEGWRLSRGARAEVALGHALRIPVAPVEAFDILRGRGFDYIEPVIHEDQLILDTPPAEAPRIFVGSESPAHSHELENLFKPSLIGLGGHLRSGKDTVADHLVEKHGYVKLNMSDFLHKALLTLNPFIPVNAQSKTGSHFISSGDFVRYSRLVEEVGYVEAKTNPEVRLLLQRLGTEVGRKILGEDTWVDLLGAAIDECRAAGDKVVITGIRYPNELDMIRSRRGSLVWVNRPGLPSSTHPSETSVVRSDFDRAVFNGRTIEDLYDEADALAWTLTRRVTVKGAAA